MAFIYDDLPVIFNLLADLTLPRQGLHDGNIDDACRLGLTTTDGADCRFVCTQKRLQPLLPLLEQLRPVHQNQRVHTTPGNQRGSRDGFSKSSGRTENPDVVRQHAFESSLLIRA
ncbi:hypothetical protein D9M68_702230 [compost metagenome]